MADHFYRRALWAAGVGTKDGRPGGMWSRMTADRDDLAAILDAHEFIPAYHGALSGRCKACHPPELDNMMGANVHRAHVAQMVLESNWLRGVRAKELRDAADAVYGDGRAEGEFWHPLSVQGWLRDRADRINAEGRSGA